MTQKRTIARTSARSGDLAGKRVSRRAEATPEVWRKTAHFSERQGQRRISDIEVGLALRFGARFHEGGDCVHFLGRKNLPLDLEGHAAAWIRERANGVVVVRRRDGSLTTTYRNPKYIAKLKRRQRRRGGWMWRSEARFFAGPQMNHAEASHDAQVPAFLLRHVDKEVIVMSG